MSRRSWSIWSVFFSTQCPCVHAWPPVCVPPKYSMHLAWGEMIVLCAQNFDPIFSTRIHTVSLLKLVYNIVCQSNVPDVHAMVTFCCSESVCCCCTIVVAALTEIFVNTCALFVVSRHCHCLIAGCADCAWLCLGGASCPLESSRGQSARSLSQVSPKCHQCSQRCHHTLNSVWLVCFGHCQCFAVLVCSYFVLIFARDHLCWMDCSQVFFAQLNLLDFGSLAESFFFGLDPPVWSLADVFWRVIFIRFFIILLAMEKKWFNFYLSLADWKPSIVIGSTSKYTYFDCEVGFIEVVSVFSIWSMSYSWI